MQRYVVSCLVVALAVGCEESATSVSRRADDTPRDAYGRPLVGADGPMHHGDGAGAPGPGPSNPLQSETSRSSVASTRFSLGAYTRHPVGSWEEAVAIGDVTCDGRPDVVLTTTSYFDAERDYRVFVFPQQANGTLGASVSYPYGATANRNGIVLADLNNDGCLDVVVGHGKGLSVLLADKATGGLKAAVVVADSDADTLSSMDVNRDGQWDIISLGWSRGASIFHGNGTGAFSQVLGFATNALGYNDHEVGDLNGDGIPDLAVMSGQGGPGLSVHLHNGTNAFSTTPRTYSVGGVGGVGLGDVNGDGRGDVVLSRPSNSPTFLSLLVQDANGNLVGPTTISSYDIPEAVQVADLDRDGDDDVVVLHGGWLKAGVYLQEDGTLMPEALYPLPYASHYAPQGLAVGDFSGDGCADVAIADYNNGLVTLLGDCPFSCATAADGTSCDDGNACTRTDTCQAGACVGADPVTCTALDQCHAVGVCNPASGVCSNPNKAEGTSCNDGNACTRADTCQAGACTGADPVICAALDQCHAIGVCDPSSGVCSNPNKADGVGCNDGNACTRADTCQAGACVGSNPVICVARDQCHAAGTCDPVSGACSNPNKADESACNDGSACTRADTCQEGTCVGADPVTCAPTDACHVGGVCDAATGMCTNPTKPDGAACDEGTCDDGVCVPTPDAGSDAGTSDAGTSDAGTTDAGTSDAGTTDAGMSDGGTSDAGTSDGGTRAPGTGGDIEAEGRCGCGATGEPYRDPTWIGLGLLFVFRRRLFGPSRRSVRGEV